MSKFVNDYDPVSGQESVHKCVEFLKSIRTKDGYKQANFHNEGRYHTPQNAQTLARELGLFSLSRQLYTVEAPPPYYEIRYDSPPPRYN